MIKVEIVPILSDNYSYILQHGGDVAVVDPGDGRAVLTALEDRALTATKIFITHHHSDHIAGITEIKQAHRCAVYGPAAEAASIPALDHMLDDGDAVRIGGEAGLVMATPGHTLGHIAFWFAESGLLFAGDTLFSLGCGRLIEGTAEQMYASLDRLRDLPDDTKLYCGHEYSLANANFALSLDPNNQALLDKIAQLKKLRANNVPTLPATLGAEKALNPFLTSKSAAEFASLRRLKDVF